MEKKDEKISILLDKIKKFKEKDQEFDLSQKEDLGVAIMNLISLEEHFFFTFEKTRDKKHLELLNETRELRKKLLGEIVKNPEGEIWCISKHLLATSMRLMEVGAKKLSAGEKEKAKDLFDKAYTLWNIFWGLNLNIIEIKDVKTDNSSEETIKLDGKKTTVWDKLGNIIKEILDCCKE